MAKKKSQKAISLLTCVVGTLPNFFSLILPAEAQDNTNNTSLQSVLLEWSNQNDPDFSQDGRPQDTAGGASRSGCQAENNLPLTALVPEASVAKTLAASPTFWFYVPHTLTSENTIEFVLKNGQDDYVYQTKFVDEISPGIVSVSLPPSVTLKVHQNYDWYFLIYCAPQNQKKFAYVNGSLQRVKLPDLQKKLKSATPMESLVIYATEKLWYDAATNLARQAIANPEAEAVRNDWHTLLQSVGLEKLATQPFVDCCSVKE